MTVPKINNNASFYSLSNLLLVLKDASLLAPHLLWRHTHVTNDVGLNNTPPPTRPSSAKWDLKLNLNELSRVTLFTLRDICLNYVDITLRDREWLM